MSDPTTWLDIVALALVLAFCGFLAWLWSR